MNITGMMAFRPNATSSGANLNNFVWGDGEIFRMTEYEIDEAVHALQLIVTNTKKAYRLHFDASKNWTGVSE